MKLPVRLNCTVCRRSLEWTVGGEPPSSSCPDCGGEVRSQVDDETGGSTVEPGPVLVPYLSPDGTLAEGPSEGARPAQIGRFLLRDWLGGGGFGEVYRAVDTHLDREVALKVLRDPSPAPRVVERFYREARAAARLDHPCIVALHDAGRADGRCWIAYQFVAGTTLGRLGAGSRLAPARAARLVRDLAGALDHAHRRGVYHRDLKPSNILIDEADRPRLTDFGLARRVDHDSTLTREGTVLGTPAYMSPEQAAGRSHQADARSDVFSLGVIFYELLCGRRPVDLPSSAPTWQAGVRPTIPKAPRALDREVPRALDRICRRALAPDPDDRYPDAGALALELDRWLARRPPWNAVALATLAGAIVALALALVLNRSRPGPPQPPFGSAPLSFRVNYAGPAGRARVETSGFVARRSAAPDREHRASFHRSSCIFLAGAGPADLVSLARAEDARASGYIPCLVCCADLQEQAAVVGDLDSRTYHRVDSACLARRPPDRGRRRSFASEAVARAEGFQPCATCQAPRP